MTTLRKPKVLLDLIFGSRHHGYAGIPQEVRLQFSGFAHSDRVTITGIVRPPSGSWLNGLSTLEEQSIFLGFAMRRKVSVDGSGIPSSLRTKLAQFMEHVVRARRSKSKLSPIVNSRLNEIIWREVFAPTLSPDTKNTVLSRQFLLSHLGGTPVSASAMLGLPSFNLATKGYDAAIFHTPMNISVSKGTTKFIRYHDAIPLFMSDMMANTYTSRWSYRSVQRSATDSIFVCSSPSSLAELGQVSALAGYNAAVIPVIVPRMTPQNTNMDHFKTASVSHVSSSTRPAGLSSFEVAERWFGEKVPRYILSISTIEPRKNYTGLIHGWQKMRHQTGGDIKLVIIGRLGWMNEEILKEMKPHVASGRLLHLEGVPSHNLPDWFKNAACFASLSYSEGFGMPPIEAMMCECPVLVSDIPAHRYVASNAAYYCDPYDVDDIAQRLRHITSSDNHGEVSNMTRLGIENAKRFTSEMIIPQWEELIEQRRRSTKIVA